jgi:hypothetical protein
MPAAHDFPVVFQPKNLTVENTGDLQCGGELWAELGDGVKG